MVKQIFLTIEICTMFCEGNNDLWLMMKGYFLLKVVLVCFYYEDEMPLLQLQKTHSDDEAVFEVYWKVAEKEGTYVYNVYQNWVLHVVSICYISECALQAPYSHHSLHPSLNLSICHLFFWGILTCTYLLAQPGLYFTCIVPLGKECGMILNKS